MSSTDIADEPVDKSLTTPKKRSKKLHRSANEKQIVLIIHKNQVQENGDMLVEEVVQKDVNEDTDLPNFKRTTFYQLLKELDFRFLKRGRNSLLLEKEEIIVWRRDYLGKIRQFRDQGRKVYYLDETWVNAGHTQGKVWMDRLNSRSKDQDGLQDVYTTVRNDFEDSSAEFIPDSDECSSSDKSV
nr:unnamed protein product [Callosobruchus chinensis]